MKKIFSTLSLAFFILMTSCGGKTSEVPGDEASLTQKEREAVAYVKKHLKKGEKLTAFEVSEGKIPVELMEREFKSDRDAIFKAGLDYNSCLTRNIPSGMEKAEKKIIETQQKILQTVETYNAETNMPTCVFVMGKVEDKNVVNNQGEYLLIVAMDRYNMKKLYWEILTTPMQKNAMMILSSINGTLLDYALNPNPDPATFVSLTTDPVVKYILDANPSLVR